jgi:succinyl-diaminopimelate desuccinylase
LVRYRPVRGDSALGALGVKETVVPKDEAVSLLQRILQTDTTNPPGNELEAAQILDDFFRAHGIETEVDEFLAGRANLLARLPGEGRDQPSLMLCGHMDVVPAGGTAWDADPFAAELRDGNIYGRGASDMKSGLAAMAIAVANLRQEETTLPGDVLFAATASEEVDCRGARRFVERGILEGVGAVVIAEPTRGDVILAHKGALWVEITTRGKSAHGSAPETGINAIEHMHHVLDELLQNLRFEVDPDPALGAPTLSVGRIEGGVAVNVVPDECRLQLDIRTVPAQDHGEILQDIEQRIVSLLDNLPDLNYEIEVMQERLAVNTPEEERIVQVAEGLREETYDSPSSRAGASYYTDASVLTESYPDLAVVLYGPGDDRLAHQPNECVDVESFVRSIGFYEQIAARYFG